MDFAPETNKAAAIEKWLDCIYAGIYFVKKEFGEDTASQICNLSLSKSCIYPYEMKLAAEHIQNGGDISKISELSVDGMLDGPPPFFPRIEDAIDDMRSSPGTIQIYKLNPYRKDYQDVKEYVDFYGMQPKPEAYLLDWEGDCGTNDLMKIYAMSHLEPVDGMPKLEYGDMVVNGDGCFFLTREMARGGTFQPVDSFDPAMIKKAPQCRFGYDLTDYDRIGMPSQLLKVADELEIPYGYDGYPDYHGSRKGEQSFEKGSYEDHQSPCYLHPAYYSGQKGEQFIQRLTALTRLTVWDEVLADLKNNKPVLLQDLDRVESQVPDLLAKKLGAMFGLSSTDGMLKGWMQFSEETAEAYEITETEFLDTIIHRFQAVSEKYGHGIAYMIYRNIDKGALLPSEFEPAAKYLHSGGTVEKMTEMADGYAFLQDVEEQSCEQDHAGFPQQQSM